MQVLPLSAATNWGHLPAIVCSIVLSLSGPYMEWLRKQHRVSGVMFAKWAKVHNLHNKMKDPSSLQCIESVS